MEISTIASATTVRPENAVQVVGPLAQVVGSRSRDMGVVVAKTSQPATAFSRTQSTFPEYLFEFLAESKPLNPIDTSGLPPEDQPATTAETGYADAGTIIGDTTDADAEKALDLLAPA